MKLLCDFILHPVLCDYFSQVLLDGLNERETTHSAQMLIIYDLFESTFLFTASRGFLPFAFTGLASARRETSAIGRNSLCCACAAVAVVTYKPNPHNTSCCVD